MSKPRVHVLENGFRIVMEHVPHARSVSAGLWLAQGSRNEEAHENGMTHFGEHLLFKGTEQFHWQRIARDINRFGGHFNAMTSTDCVKLYGRVIRRDFHDALSLIAEMFLRSTFPASEVNREREVILEEIAMYEDIPEDLCYEHFTRALYLPHPVGRPVIGTEELVSGFSRESLFEYWQTHLAPSRMILSVAGDINEDEDLELCRQLFGGLDRLAPELKGMDGVEGKHSRVLLDRDLEQVNFCLGMTGPKRNGEERFAWALYDTILGGGMGSRLFDEVREKRGLAYGIGSSINAMFDAGYLVISGSTRPEHASLAVEICLEEVRKLASGGPTASEIDTAKRQLERSHLLGMESLGARADVNGDRLLYGLEYLSSEEVIARIEKVTPDDLKAVAQQVVDFGVPAACLVGPLENAPGVGELFSRAESA